MERDSQEIARILELYTGPEKERVRAAVVKLAGKDIEHVSYYVSVAHESYEALLQCAEQGQASSKNGELRVASDFSFE